MRVADVDEGNDGIQHAGAEDVRTLHQRGHLATGVVAPQEQPARRTLRCHVERPSKYLSTSTATNTKCVSNEQSQAHNITRANLGHVLLNVGDA